jgi:hypothetical protein
MKTYKMFIFKVNGYLYKASKENWNWQEAQEILKQLDGNDPVIEFVSESVWTDEDLKYFEL